MDQCKCFGSGVIRLGEIEVSLANSLELTWRSSDGQAAFYKPVSVPPGFHALGHHVVEERGQVSSAGDRYLLLVRQTPEHQAGGGETGAPAGKLPPLSSPVDYTDVGKVSGNGENKEVSFWLPVPAAGYKPAGYIVSRSKPSVEEVVCVREDLTCESATFRLAWKTGFSLDSSSTGPSKSALSCWIQAVFRRRRESVNSNVADLYVWHTRPAQIGVTSQCLQTGTFHCSASDLGGTIFAVRTLRNIKFQLRESMPDMQQVHELVRRYAPILMLHPDESFFPASVEWFFQNGALLYRADDPDNPVSVAADGFNLPTGGDNDGAFWLDLPRDEAAANKVRKGELTSATVYLHVKPMYGGSYTDLQFWFYYPFNGPATLKVGPLDLRLNKIGQHVSDWEHVTIRINNFSGTLARIYLGHHSGGTWYQPSDLEYDKSKNRPIVYASKHGHACYAEPGSHLQGDQDRGVGIRNDTKPSSLTLDVANSYQIVSAGYLGVEEPVWLQYAREWGPKVQYNSRTELERVVKLLPKKVRKNLEDLFDKFPDELSGEEGPVGPKGKNFWDGEER